MYNMLGPYDPSNKQAKHYKHKKVIEIYKKISEEKVTQTYIFLELHKIIATINKRI